MTEDSPSDLPSEATPDSDAEPEAPNELTVPDGDPDPSFWSSVREALAGSHQDYTEGPLGRAIFLLAIPMVLEMVMESLFAVVDIFFVARLGADATAAVGLTESVMTLIYAVAIGLAMATTAMVARRIGEKDPAGASKAAAQAIWLGVGLAALLGVCGVLFGEDILRLMGGSPELIAGGQGYTRVLIGTNVVVMLLFLNNAIFRGAGDAAIAMRVLWIANGINIVLDPCLIFGLGPFPELGLTGAAVATSIGRGTGVLIQLWVLFGGKGRIDLNRSTFRFDPAVAMRLIKVSLGGVFQFLIATTSWVGLVRILAVFGSMALAGYTIAIRIVIFIFLPAWGLSNAAATLVGQSLGAQKPDRAERSVWLTGFYNMIFLTSVGLAFFIFARPLMGLFTSDPEIIKIGAECLRVVSVGYPIYAWGMVLVQALNGAGDTWTPTWINLFCFWLFQIPLAYFLARSAGFEHRGVFIAIVAAEAAFTVAAFVMVKRGGWKNREV